jgi:hypothetical protein
LPAVDAQDEVEILLVIEVASAQAVAIMGVLLEDGSGSDLGK